MHTYKTEKAQWFVGLYSVHCGTDVKFLPGAFNRTQVSSVLPNVVKNEGLGISGVEAGQRRASANTSFKAPRGP